jgi:hypothetical protein
MLYVERSLAEETGLTSDPAYMADLLEDISAHECAYTGAAVIEIATLRAELSGPQLG